MMPISIGLLMGIGGGGVGGGAIVAPYLGQLATRCYQPDTALAGASATWQSGRTAHYAVADIVDPIIVYANYAVGGSNVESVKAGGTAKCAVETTLGTRLAINDGGAVAFSNGFAVCKFTGLTIPKGWFWLDFLIENANGVMFWQRGIDANLTTEGWRFGTGAPVDYTISGTPPNGFVNSQGYGPTLILGQTTLPSVVLLGTSKAHGQADFVSDTTGDKGYIRLLAQKFGYTSLAIPSSLLSAFMADSRTYRSQILNGTIDGINTGVPYHSHMINYDLVNDFQSGGDSTATAVGRLVSLNAAYPKLKHIDITNTPKPSSTDLFDTIVNQSVDTVGTKMLAANDLIRAGIAGSNTYLDLADLLDPTRSGKWPVSSDPAATAITQSTFTAAVSGQTMTVSGGVTGPALAVGMSVHGSGVSTGTQIAALMTGTGGNGTYKLSQSMTVSSEAMTADSTITWDGLHENAVTYGLIRDRGASLLDRITR